MTALRRALTPLVPLYCLGLALRENRLKSGREPVRRLRFPVISIGNLSTGGAGKTPLTIALAQGLSRRGFNVDVLSRGYGRKSKLPALVDPTGTAGEFGDEPLLIARETRAPVYVARKRYEAGWLAESKSPQDALVHILDDGFQHRQLHRDIDILLLNREDWRDRLLPAGNLREPLQAAMRANVIAIPSSDPELEDELRAWGWSGAVWRLHRRMEIPDLSSPVVAFCGIARPDQFFSGLESQGLRLAARVVFPDHHSYTIGDIQRLIAMEECSGASALITTEKDKVRLEMFSDHFPGYLTLKTARLTAEIENEAAALDWLSSRFASAKSEPEL